MSATSAELSSLAATVEELVRRLDTLAEAYGTARRDDLVSEVHEVERNLTAAHRRLARMSTASGA